jgi:CRISPR-associated protein Csx14
MTPVLIATLGAEPQVVPLAARLLLRSHPLHHIIVLHTDAAYAPITDARTRLVAAFAAATDLPSLRLVALPIRDVLTPAELDCFADALFTTIQAAQTAGHSVHLLLAGGRKSMSMVGMSVAHLLLGDEDAVWYLYSDPALAASARMVPAAGDEVALVAIPLPRPTLAAPRYTPAGQAATRADALAATHRLAADQARAFLEHDLTRAEREVVALVAGDLLTVPEIAARLHKSPKTVTNQLTTIYSKLEARFGLEPNPALKREFLRRELSPYLSHPTPS